MKRCITYLTFLLTINMFADSYWLQFKDKSGSEGNLSEPEQFLSERAITRRLNQDIPLDSLDLPVSKTYMDAVRSTGAKIVHCSRWLNGVTLESDSEETLKQLQTLDFVTYMQRTKCDACGQTYSLLPQKADNSQPIQASTNSASSTNSAYGSAQRQTEQLNLHKLHELGYNGQNILITVVDDGFYRADKLTAFDAVRDQIIGTCDLVSRGGNVYAQGSHGSMVLSIIAASCNEMIGAATGSEYYLIRTEDDDYENLRELDAQVAAYEIADSIGADIVTCSLGYLDLFDDPETRMSYSELDGKTYRNSRAATIAARKGLIVLNAMGNEGSTYDTWHYLDAPADADSILSVGAVTSSGERSSFSSWGPTADGRQKPEVSAMGTATAYIHPYYDKASTGNGTSFSTPLMAGFAASLWSALPQENNMQIIDRIIKSASQYDSPDYGIGYGIPDAMKAYEMTTNLPTTIQQQIMSPILHIYDLQGRVYNTTIESLPKGFYIIQTPTNIYKIIR